METQHHHCDMNLLIVNIAWWLTKHSQEIARKQVLFSWEIGRHVYKIVIKERKRVEI